MSHPYQAFEIIGANRRSDLLIIGDHAANTVPMQVQGGSLGLSARDMARHIAYDPGTREVCGHLGTLLNAPVLLSNFSRLVIDPNRGEDDPTLVMKLYDGTIIPGNRLAGAAEVKRRLDLCYRPYHAALARLMGAGQRRIISIHSFTPQLKARAHRPWQIGVLHTKDRRLSTPILQALQAQPDLCIGDNQPYNGDLEGDTLDRHIDLKAPAHLLLEIRNDLIASNEGQLAWAQRLAGILTATIAPSNP